VLEGVSETPGGKLYDRLEMKRGYVSGKRPQHERRAFYVVLLLGLLTTDGGAHLRVARADPQQNVNEESSQEVVANLAAGRVEIVVAKDQIVIGTLQNPIEAGSVPPQIVEMAGRRAGILLGAVDWRSTTSREYLAQLGRELPRLRTLPGKDDGPHLEQGTSEGPAKDIEMTGLGVYKRMDELVRQLHAPVGVKSGENVLQVVLAGYVTNYGPDVWILDYAVEQEMLRQDFWTSRAQHPRYTQAWPPIKAAPQTLMEFCYPSDCVPSLQEEFHVANSPVARIVQIDSQMQTVEGEILNGQSTRVKGEDAIRFLRATLDALRKPGDAESIAVVDQQNGFGWVLKPSPPKEPENKTPRPPGSPTLIKPSS
jgi:hypothetical protein